MREVTKTAEQLRKLRSDLDLTQRELADRLGVSCRTIIRGEQRGIEVPWFSVSATRHGMLDRWNELQRVVADRAAREKSQSVTKGRSGSPRPQGDTSSRIHVKVSHRRRRSR